MRNKPRLALHRLRDILEAIGNIRSDIGAMSKEQFMGDGKTQRAVVESFIVVGEAASSLMQLEPQLEHGSPALWLQLRNAYGMRNLLTHAYFRADMSVVWDTTARDLPSLDALVSAAVVARDPDSAERPG